MPVDPPRADVALVAGDPAVADALGAVAIAYGCALDVISPTGSVVASSGTGGGGPPAEAAILVYDEPVGSVAARATREGASPADAARVAAGILGALAAKDYEQESLAKSLLDSYEEVNLFYGITARVHAVGTIEEICSTILEQACEIVKVARATILLADERTGVLRIVAFRGMTAEHAARVRVSPGEGIIGKVMATNQAMLVDDAHGLDRAKQAGEAPRYATRSFISLPLRVFDPASESGAVPGSRRPLGVLNMTDKQGGGTFTAGDMKLLSALASQAAVLIDNARLAGIEKEMGIARRIQASLLPAKPPRIPGAELAGACVPAKNVGGDYYDLIPIPGGRVAILIADVSGHNIGAALMMAVSRAVLRSCIQTDPAPEKVLAAANALLIDDLARSELFVSVFVAVYDPAARLLAFANGGHNKPLLLRAGAAGEEWLDAEGILLGVIEGAEFERKEIAFGPGDLLFLYTDGLPEAHGDDSEQWGEERMAALVRREAGAPLADLPLRLLEELDRFTGVPAGDDRTMVLLRGAS